MDDPSYIEEKDIKEVFTLFDVDGSGFISADALESAIICLGKTPSDDDKNELVDDTISEASFTKLMQRKAQEGHSIDEFNRAFLVYDREGFGSVTSDDLRKALMSHDNSLTAKTADDLLRDADIDPKAKHIVYNSELVQLLESEEQ